MQYCGQEVSYNNQYSLTKAVSVLVVEDDRTHRSLMEKILKSCNIETHSAENGVVALAKLADGVDIDLILLDLDMPMMDGLETVQRIRQKEVELNLPHMPVIAFTAHRDPGDCERCLAAGMDGYLPKTAWLPKWRQILIDNLQGLVAGEFSFKDFDAASMLNMKDDVSVEDDNKNTKGGDALPLDIFDAAAYDHAASLLKDELEIALEEFLEDADIYMSGIRQGYEESNLDKVAKSSHPLKSNTRSFGLTAVADIAQNINMISRNAEGNNQKVLTEIGELFDALEDAFAIGREILIQRVHVKN